MRRIFLVKGLCAISTTIAVTTRAQVMYFSLGISAFYTKVMSNFLHFKRALLRFIKDTATTSLPTITIFLRPVTRPPTIWSWLVSRTWCKSWCKSPLPPARWAPICDIIWVIIVGSIAISSSAVNIKCTTALLLRDANSGDWLTYTCLLTLYISYIKLAICTIGTIKLASTLPK